MKKKFLSAVLSASMLLAPLVGNSCFADEVIMQNGEESYLNCTETPEACDEWSEESENQLSFQGILQRFHSAMSIALAFWIWNRAIEAARIINKIDKSLILLSELLNTVERPEVNNDKNATG